MVDRTSSNVQNMVVAQETNVALQMGEDYCGIISQAWEPDQWVLLTNDAIMVRTPKYMAASESTYV